MSTFTLKERFTDKLQTAAGLLLPGMFKRLMYISCLLAVIDIQHASDQVMARKLNDIFELNKSPSIVTDTMYVKDVIWKEFIHEKTFVYNGKKFDLNLLKDGKYSAIDIDNVASHLIETTPKWIRYANEDVMRYDIKKLFRSLPELSMA